MITLYGLVYATGFVAVFFILRSYFRRSSRDPDLALTAMLYVIPSVLLGARLIYILYYNPQLMLAEPASIITFWQGGLSFHGGLLGAVIASYLFCKKNHINPLEFADTVTPTVLVFLILGRIANFFNGELYGIATNVSWCITFSTADGCRHPIQLYDAAKNLIVLGILLYIRKYHMREGILFFLFLFLSSLGRLFIDSYREYTTYYLGIGAEQYLNALTLLIAAFSIYYLKKKERV